MSKINVLLSTYNGVKYITELIDSILNQDDVNINLLVRDDGSSDSTPLILNEYQSKGKLTWYKGKNLKPARSFMQLLQDSSIADYYAFADQDDYWNSDKLSCAIKKIANYEDIPTLYFSQTQLTDAHLNPIAGPTIKPKLTFGESLVYEFIPGCTMVFNKKLRDIINQYQPEYLPMHDVWIYSIALAVGAKIIFDKNPHILYRQHDNNTIGQGQGETHEWKRRYLRLIHKEHSRLRRAKELKKGFYKMMSPENQEILSTFINGRKKFANKLRLITDERFKCANKRTYHLFQLAVILGIY